MPDEVRKGANPGPSVMPLAPAAAAAAVRGAPSAPSAAAVTWTSPRGLPAAAGAAASIHSSSSSCSAAAALARLGHLKKSASFAPAIPKDPSLLQLMVLAAVTKELADTNPALLGELNSRPASSSDIAPAARSAASPSPPLLSQWRWVPEGCGIPPGSSPVLSMRGCCCWWRWCGSPPAAAAAWPPMYLPSAMTLPACCCCCSVSSGCVTAVCLLVGPRCCPCAPWPLLLLGSDMDRVLMGRKLGERGRSSAATAPGAAAAAGLPTWSPTH